MVSLHHPSSIPFQFVSVLMPTWSTPTSFVTWSMWSRNMSTVERFFDWSADSRGGQAQSPITPPFSARALMVSSLVFLGDGNRAWLLECDSITGSLDCSMASLMVMSLAWETSMTTPMLFISSTTPRPNGVSPVSRRSQHPVPTGVWEL